MCIRDSNSPVTHGRQIRLEFLAKLYFAQRQSSEVAYNLIEQQLVACHSWLAEMREQTQIQKHRQAETYFPVAVQQFRLSQIESFITWLTTCRQTLLAAVESE